MYNSKNVVFYLASLFFILSCTESDMVNQEMEIFNFQNSKEFPDDYNKLKTFLIAEGVHPDNINFIPQLNTFIVEGDMGYTVDDIRNVIRKTEKNNEKHQARECNWPPISARSFEGQGGGHRERFEIGLYIRNEQNWPPHWIQAINRAVDRWNELENLSIRFYFQCEDNSLAEDGVIINLRDFGPSFTGIAALTTTTLITPFLGDIIEINNTSSEFLLTDPNSIEFKSFIFAHELGHIIGYRHTDSNDGCRVFYLGSPRTTSDDYFSPQNDPGSLMNALAPPRDNFSVQWNFSASDIEAHNKLYRYWGVTCSDRYGCRTPTTIRLGKDPC